VQSFWDERFRTEDFIYGTEPNEFLVQESGRLPAGGSVLLPGDGEGRNGVWLAERGMTVLSVDGAASGTAKTLKLAAQRGVSLNAETADLTKWTWPEAAFDALVLMFLHLPPSLRRLVHAKAAAALKPGGVILLEAFRPAQLGRTSGGPKDVALLYTPQDLKEDFAVLDIRLLEEAMTHLKEGTLHDGAAATIRLIAYRPPES